MKDSHEELAKLQRELRKKGSKEKAKKSAWFFKTGEGQYGAHDKFLGVTVPEVRVLAKQYRDLPLVELHELLQSQFNEERLLALIILIDQYRCLNATVKQKIFTFYLKERRQVNNWNLVDSSAHYIVGETLVTEERTLLYRLLSSKNMWERRIAIIATWAFIKRGDLDDTFAIAEKLFADKEDLMHKAVGWMLREAGKKDQKRLKMFLLKHIKIIPRTTLRYAIERFPVDERKGMLLR